MGNVSQATDARHDNNIEDWRLIDRMTSADPEKARQELVRGPYESKLEFEGRRKKSDHHRYTHDIVSRLVGELFTQAGKITRETEASDSFLSSVGPDGQSYESQMINTAETLVAYNECWLVMDPSQGLLITEPQHVTRSGITAQGQDFAVVKGTITRGGGPFTDETEEPAWTIYYPDRYETYVRADEDEDREEVLFDSGFYRREGWSFSGGAPVVRATLPWKAEFGKAIAYQHRQLYRAESEYDAAVNKAQNPLLQYATGDDDDMAERFKKAVKSGAAAIPYDSDLGEHKPLNMGVGGIEHGRKKVERKTKELYRTAHQSLEDVSQRMTATEADARIRGGPAAAKAVLAHAMESAEERILPFVAQAEDARRASQELSPSADWPTDYSRYDNDTEKLVQQVFGKLNLPVPVDAATDVVVKRLDDAGISADRGAIESEVRRRRDRAEQAPTDETFVS